MKRLPIYLFLLLLLTCAKEDNTSLIEGYQLQISQLNSKITEYSNQVTQLQSTVNSLNSQVNTIPGLEDTITSLNEQIGELEDTIAALTSEVSTIPDLNDEITGLEETIASLNEQIVSLETIINTRTVTVSSTEGGSVTGGGDYLVGTEITITAEPDEGFRFDKWSNGNKDINYQFTITTDTILSASFTALNFNSSTMEEIKYGYYTKDTLNGKRTVDLKEFYFPYLGWKFDVDVEEELDYLSSENFIVYWDKRYDHREYAIDILRWSEFSAEKAINSGNRKPKDYDTHRVNIFIFRNDEFGDDIFGPDFGQAAHTDSNFRSFITYPYYNNFNNIVHRNFPTMNVLHETYHIFQSSHNPLFDSRRWYRESTADYFESIYVADVRPRTLRFIAHFLQSTNIRLWKGYNSSPSELQHAYGLQLLFHYLEWEGIIDENFIGNSWSDTSMGETPLEYLIRKIPSFENVFFDFSLKSTVIDFPMWTNLIYEELDILDNSNYWKVGRRHDLVLQNEGTNGFYEIENHLEAWSFVSLKINNSEESNYTFNADSNYDSIRVGLVKELNNEFEYQEINNGYNFTLNENQDAYIVIVNITDSYYGEETYPFSLEIIKGE